MSEHFTGDGCSTTDYDGIRAHDDAVMQWSEWSDEFEFDSEFDDQFDAMSDDAIDAMYDAHYGGTNYGVESGNMDTYG